MIQHRRLEHKFVEDIPETLEAGFLYVSVRYATAMHLCCCGCGREVVTPFSPAQWHMTYDGESISLHPSIGNWNIACKSHYIIKNGRVIEALTWSEKAVIYGQARDKHVRAAYYAAKDVVADEAETESLSTPVARLHWIRKIGDFLTKHR